MKPGHMMMTAFLAAAMTSCRAMAPVKVNAGGQCFRCRRSILDERLAAETIDANGFASKFHSGMRRSA